jgi:hypothetical protein
LVHGGGKGLLGCVFGGIEVAEEANQGRDDPTPVGAIERIQCGGDILRHA